MAAFMSSRTALRPASPGSLPGGTAGAAADAALTAATFFPHVGVGEEAAAIEFGEAAIVCTGTKPLGMLPGIGGNGLEDPGVVVAPPALFLLPEEGSGVSLPNSLTPPVSSAPPVADFVPPPAAAVPKGVVTGGGVPDTMRSLSCFCADSRSREPAWTACNNCNPKATWSSLAGPEDAGAVVAGVVGGAAGRALFAPAGVTADAEAENVEAAGEGAKVGFSMVANPTAAAGLDVAAAAGEAAAADDAALAPNPDAPVPIPNENPPTPPAAGAVTPNGEAAAPDDGATPPNAAGVAPLPSALSKSSWSAFCAAA